MRHNNSYRKLGRDAAHRRALLRNMATSFFEHGRIETTLPKAKELRPLVEKLITGARAGSLHERRQAEQYLFVKDVTKRLFNEVAPRFSTRPGGYTRIVKFGPRFGDGAEMCALELLDYWDVEGKKANEIRVKKAEAKARRAAEADASEGAV